MHDKFKINNLNDLPQKDNVRILLNPEDFEIKITDIIPELAGVFFVFSFLLCSLGNILTIKAKQKAGKTFLVSIFIACLFKGEFLSFRGIKRKSIAWIDSEQSKPQCQKILKRTFRMSGLPPFVDNADLRMFYAAELDVSQRWELFEQLAQDPQFDVIIIDVSTDLINDINDAVETKKAVDLVQKIAKENNILVIATIHENKLSSNATGHFGGSLQKKSEAVISLIKADGVFTIQATDTRHGDWEDFSFRIDEEGLPVAMDAPVKMSATQVKEANIQNNLRHVLTMKRLTFTELIDSYVSRELCSASTAKRHIKTALSHDWLNIQSDNRYMLTKNDTDESSFQ